jgi:hypothetical protein
LRYDQINSPKQLKNVKKRIYLKVINFEFEFYKTEKISFMIIFVRLCTHFAANSLSILINLFVCKIEHLLKKIK